MPYRFNEPRRHKIPRARYRVQNWPEYDRALQRRGDLTVWVTPEAIAAWCPPRTGRRGRPRDYSDVAIETGHLLRLVFGRPWRQTEGLLRSITALLGLELGIPDHTTFSRRSPGLVLAKSLAPARAGGGPVHMVIDATGLKVFGAGEWLAEKHGERGKRTWRKLHLAVDCGTGEILACEPTTNEERRLPGRPLARADLGPPRLGDRGRGIRWRARLPGRVRPSARPARGRGHPAALDRGTERGCRRRAHAAGPPCSADPRQGAHGVAKSNWIRQTIAGGDGHVAL